MRALLALLLLTPPWLYAHDAGPVEGHNNGRIDCQQSVADEFGCLRVDVLSHMSINTLGGGIAANDIWGWTDTLTGNEYVLIGTFQGTVFVDISNPETPVRLGFLPGHDELRCRSGGTRSDDAGCGQGSAWRDIKVYADHAFVVSEAAGHGMQVFDLRELRDVTAPQVFRETAWYNGFGSAHNIAINEETGFAYAVGTTTHLGGPHFIDISTPAEPRGAGGFFDDGYTHDAQCVVYRGPDADYTDAEICFLSNEDTVTIANVTDKSNPVMISRSGYAGASYTHQGWLDEDHIWFYVNDEVDETLLGGQTFTYIWNMSNLDTPVLASTYRGMTESIDHNNYVRGDYLYQSNYTTGLRILDISTRNQPLEVAWFDSFPNDDFATYDGSWSNYPYFDSGVIALSDMDAGLFLLRSTLSPALPEGDLEIVIANLVQPDTTRLQYRYDATASNLGSEILEDVVISHVLDPSVSNFTVSGATCSRRGRFAECAVGPLTAGASVTLGLTLNATTGGNKSNQIQVTSRNADPDTTNNKAIGSLSLLPAGGSAPGESAGGGGGVALWGSVFLLLIGMLRRYRFGSRSQPVNI